MICPKQLVPIQNQTLITTIVYNEHGTILAVGDQKGLIRIHKNDSDFTLLQTITSHSGPVSFLTFSSIEQGNLLLSGGQDMSFKIYQTNNTHLFDEIYSQNIHQSVVVGCLSLIANHQLLFLSLDTSGTLVIQELKDSQIRQKQILQIQTIDVNCLRVCRSESNTCILVSNVHGDLFFIEQQPQSLDHEQFQIVDVANMNQQVNSFDVIDGQLLVQTQNQLLLLQIDTQSHTIISQQVIYQSDELHGFDINHLQKNIIISLKNEQQVILKNQSNQWIALQN